MSSGNKLASRPRAKSPLKSSLSRIARNSDLCNLASLKRFLFYFLFLRPDLRRKIQRTFFDSEIFCSLQLIFRQIQTTQKPTVFMSDIDQVSYIIPSSATRPYLSANAGSKEAETNNLSIKLSLLFCSRFSHQSGWICTFSEYVKKNLSRPSVILLEGSVLRLSINDLHAWPFSFSHVKTTQ